MAWYHRLLNVGRTGRVNREIDREQEFHIAERVDELVAAGWSEAAALREARRRFGNPTYQRERTRDADVVLWLDSFLRDVRQAFRALGRAPVFASVAVLSLALGIGANTAVFSLIEAVVLRPLPVPHPEELVVLGYDDAPAPSFTNPLWEEIRDRQEGLSAVAAFSETSFNTAAGGEPRRVSGMWVSGDYFHLFGVAPAAGRLLTPDDDVRGCAPVAVLGHGYWQREHGGDASVVGRALRLEGVPFEVVGVARAGFDGPEVGREAEVYAPICAKAATSSDGGNLDHRSAWWLRVMGRLEPGTSVSQLNARLAVISPAVFGATVPENYSTEHQAEYRERQLTATDAATGLSMLRDRYAEALLMLMTGVGLVLLIACANVANLLLARATARERELAIRAAIGAGRGRLSRQVVTEALVLATLGAAAGLLLARVGAGGLVALISAGGDAIALDLALNLRVLAFTTAVAVATVLAFGVLPAWRAGRVDPQATMSSHARGIAEGHRRFSVGKALVTGQVALSLVLLVGAGLLVGSLRNLTMVDPGFTAEGVLLADVDVRTASLGDDGTAGFVRRALDRIRAVPGVQGASASALTPIGGAHWNDLLVVEGYEPARELDALVWFNEVSAGYFETMETRFLTGRDFDATDAPGAARVAIVTESVAGKFFGGSAVGETFRTRIGDGFSEPYTIVGVVEDVKYSSLREDESGTVFLATSQAQGPIPFTSFEIRTQGRPGVLAAAVRQAIAEVDPRVTVETETLSDQVAASLQRERMLAILSGLFAGIALALAMLGLYGIMAYMVARRRNEIGVRIALGADGGRVLRMVLRDAGLVLGIGLVIGAIGAVASGRLVQGFLFRLSPGDPLVVGGAAALLALVALTAAAIPAWRAARMDPTAALREE